MQEISPTPEIQEISTLETESEDEKPDFVKKIESFDINNLTSENIEFISQTIQNYFLETFPVKPEIIERLPDHITILNAEEFRDKMGEDVKIINPDEMTGFYSPDFDKIFINKSTHKTPEALFTTMFHESLHFASIEAGAGLTGEFLCPEDAHNENIDSQIYTGLHTLEEGTTQLITFASVIDDMGFNRETTMFGYESEWHIMRTIWTPFSRNVLHAYFEMPIEDLRAHIEKIFEPNGQLPPKRTNGVFTECLSQIGIATENMNEALETWGKGGDPDQVLTDIRHAVGLYIVQDCKVNNKELTEDDKEWLHEYLEPYIKDKEANVQ
ncbi:hypothetical protein IJI18_01235 [Candidatus Saccharibacteria bacterium]|nr:hypothetical protein [Candidatus Saccharibacteria bacterium]MBQ7040983.1 hypothetical protein [Candidatus Saccharibacteria bacterium]